MRLVIEFANIRLKHKHQIELQLNNRLCCFSELDSFCEVDHSNAGVLPNKILSRFCFSETYEYAQHNTTQHNTTQHNPVQPNAQIVQKIVEVTHVQENGLACDLKN